MIKRNLLFITIAVNLVITFITDLSFSLECFNSQFLFEIGTSADQPSDLALAPNGDIYLVDGVNHRIMVFDDQGRLKFVFGDRGDNQGEFRHPLGIDISRDREIFIADTGNHRIQVFDLKGNFLTMFSISKARAEKPADPVDVLVSRLNNYLYVSDNDNHKIKVFDRKGDLKFQWGKFGEGPGEFRFPAILAANEFNQIFVVDVLNTRIQLFDPFGKFIDEIGGWGVAPGKLFRPKGIVVDKKNRVFVSDSYMGLIQVYTGLGRFLGAFCENNQKRPFVTPVGIMVDEKRNRLYVVEMRANKISVFKILN